MSLKGRQKKAKYTRIKGKPGRVIGTVGRRVLVRDVDGERVCYLSGQRAVIGDRVRWEELGGFKSLFIFFPGKVTFIA